MKRKRLIAGCFSGAALCGAALVLLTGCDSNAFGHPPATLKRSEFTVKVREAELAANVYGLSVWDEAGQTCHVILLQYPTCLLHEIRHCIEGNWHPGDETTEDC